MSQNPWWHPSDDDLGWDEPLPVIIRLAPDYSAPLPLWGEASAISTGGIPSSRPRCSTGSPPGSRSSTTTTTTRPAGDPPQLGTAGLTTPRAWQQTCGQSWAPERNSSWISGPWAEKPRGGVKDQVRLGNISAGISAGRGLFMCEAIAAPE